MINILGVAKDIRPCPKCGCYTIEYRSMGPHIGKYCTNCTKWIKWVSRKDMPEEIVARVTSDDAVIEDICDDTNENDTNEEYDTPWF